MPANVARVRRAQPVRSPERAALAEAIAKHREAEGAVVAACARLATANEATAQAETALVTCNAAVATAKDQLAADIASGSHTATDIKAARTAETDAADHLAAARAAIEATEAALAQAERDENSASRGLESAVRTVLRAGIPTQALLDKAEDIQQALIEVRLLLRHLHRSGWIGGDTSDVLTFLDTIHDVLPSRFQPSFNNWDDWTSPTLSQWEAAAEALRTDADAELPSI